MKTVCHCFDDIVREYRYVQRHYKDPDGSLVHYGYLGDVMLCYLSKDQNGWFYILIPNKLTDDSTIPDSVRVGYGFTTRQMCFKFVVNLCQIHRGDNKTMINNFQNSKSLYLKFKEDTSNTDLWPVWKEKYTRFN